MENTLLIDIRLQQYVPFETNTFRKLTLFFLKGALFRILFTYHPGTVIRTFGPPGLFDHQYCRIQGKK